MKVKLFLTSLVAVTVFRFKSNMVHFCVIEKDFRKLRRSTALRPASIAALSVAKAQRSTLRHAQQENNEVRDDRVLSYLRAMGIEPLSTSRCTSRANESALMEASRYREELSHY